MTLHPLIWMCLIQDLFDLEFNFGPIITVHLHAVCVFSILYSRKYMHKI